MKLRNPVMSGLMAMLSMVTVGGVLLSGPAFAAGGGEQAKLKELQRALAAPPQQADEFAPKAIVFDRDEKPSVPAQGDGSRPAAAGPSDCSLLSPDTPATPIDFAIQFKVNSAELSPVSEGTLKEIAKILALTPDRCVFVEGHTDASGNSDLNLKLSRERANSVVNFIVGRAGVLRSRLITFGKGSTEPIKGLEPRDPKNRRVSFKVAG